MSSAAQNYWTTNFPQTGFDFVEEGAPYALTDGTHSMYFFALTTNYRAGT